MKEYEKLAREYGPINEDPTRIHAAFIAGFLKAREMAINIPFVCRNDLEQLGEKKEIETKKDPSQA